MHPVRPFKLIFEKVKCGVLALVAWFSRIFNKISKDTTPFRMLSKCHFKVHSSIIKMTTEKLWLFWYSTACTARAHNFICLWFNNILLTEML